MQKTQRFEAVRKIIREKRIESQEQLLNELHRKGFDVTQATLSRDLKQLKVAKVPDGVSGYKYTIPEYQKPQREAGAASVYIEDLRRGFVSLAFSGNICVISTLEGHANSVASAIDNIEVPGILGTLAGDDTIMAVLSEGSDRREIEDFFRGIE